MNKNSERISQTFPRDSPKLPRDPPRFNNHSERISYTFPRDPPKNRDRGQRKTRTTWGELKKLEFGLQVIHKLSNLAPRGRLKGDFWSQVTPRCPREFPKGPQGVPKDSKRLPKSIPERTPRPTQAPKKSTHFLNLDLCTGAVFWSLPSRKSTTITTLWAHSNYPFSLKVTKTLPLPCF